MEVLSALLCDAAADYHGKLSILGAFDTLVVRQFPAVHPQCAIALRLLFRAGEEGTHSFSLHLVDSDGKDVVPEIRPRIEVKIPEHLFFLSQNMVFNLQGIPFQSAGQYSIDVTMDGAAIASIPLQILEWRPPIQGPAA